MNLDIDTITDTKSPHYRNRDNIEYGVGNFCAPHIMWLKN